MKTIFLVLCVVIHITVKSQAQAPARYNGGDQGWPEPIKPNKCTPCNDNSDYDRSMNSQDPAYRGNGADNLGYDWSPQAWGGPAFPTKSKPQDDRWGQNDRGSRKMPDWDQGRKCPACDEHSRNPDGQERGERVLSPEIGVHFRGEEMDTRWGQKPRWDGFNNGMPMNDRRDRYGQNNRIPTSFKPWDGTEKGSAGWDNSGKGYYFANKPESSNDRYASNWNHGDRDKNWSPGYPGNHNPVSSPNRPHDNMDRYYTQYGDKDPYGPGQSKPNQYEPSRPYWSNQARPGYPSDRPDRPNYGNPSDNRPPYGRPPYDRPNDVRPSYERPLDIRPSYERPPDRPNYGRPDNRPSYESSNSVRPSDNRPSYGRPNDNRPSYERPSDSRPSYERPSDNRPSYERPGANRPSYERPSDNRPSYERPGDNRPSYERPIDNRPSYERPIDHRPSYERPADYRPSYERPTDHRPSYERPSYERPSDNKYPTDDRTTKRPWYDNQSPNKYPYDYSTARPNYPSTRPSESYLPYDKDHKPNQNYPTKAPPWGTPDQGYGRPDQPQGPHSQGQYIGFITELGSNDRLKPSYSGTDDKNRPSSDRYRPNPDRYPSDSERDKYPDQDRYRPSSDRDRNPDRNDRYPSNDQYADQNRYPNEDRRPQDNSSWNYGDNNRDGTYHRQGGSYPPYRGGQYYTSSYLASASTTVGSKTTPVDETTQSSGEKT